MFIPGEALNRGRTGQSALLTPCRFFPQMVSSICQRLINKVWRSYADYLDRVPRAEGIYAIGKANGEVLYVGQSNDVHRRLGEHKRKKFKKNGRKHLQIKWVEDKDHKCVEGHYLECIEKKLGYRPRYNIKGGNKC